MALCKTCNSIGHTAYKLVIGRLTITSLDCQMCMCLNDRFNLFSLRLKIITTLRRKHLGEIP